MEFLLRHRFKILLATLLGLFVTVPLLLGDYAETLGTAGRAVALAVTIGLLCSASLAVGGRRGAKWFLLCLALPSLLIEIVAALALPDEVAICNHAMRIVFLGFIIVQLLAHLFDPELVTFDTLCASLCVYLLLGLMWMNAYVILEILKPGSFMTTVPVAGVGQEPLMEAARTVRLFYFSFTTLTGVGFGDIVPTTHAARVCAITESLTGQGYLLIMVSRLVGMHVSQSLANGSVPLGPDAPRQGSRED